MTLRFIVSEEQLKILKLSIHTLSKFGYETLFEAQPGSLDLRSVNTSKSAYARISFRSSFFDAFEVFEQPHITASILTKSLLASFRTQRIFRVIVEIFTRENKMIVFLDCESGLQKKFELDLTDTDPVHTNINFDTYPVRITVETSEMSRFLASFQNSLEEITIIALPDGSGQDVTNKSCQIHSFYNPARMDLSNALLHTQLSLNAHQRFLDYQHSGNEAVDVTLNLKDLRAIMAYCTSTKSNMQIVFSSPGEPLAVFPIPSHESGNIGFSSEFVLATMLDSCMKDLNKGALRAVENGRNRAHYDQDKSTGSAAHPQVLSNVNSHDAADNLLLMREKTPMNGRSNVTALSSDTYQQSTKALKRQRTAEHGSTTVSAQEVDQVCHGENGHDEATEPEEEIPGTPPHEREHGSWQQNWS